MNYKQDVYNITTKRSNNTIKYNKNKNYKKEKEKDLNRREAIRGLYTRGWPLNGALKSRGP